MQTATKGDTVLIDYIFRTTDGRVVGKTNDNEPISLKVGDAEIFPQVDAALDGMEVGKQCSVTVNADDAFGPRRNDMIIEIPRDQLQADQAPEPGMTLSAQQQDGSTVNFTITAVSPETITADGNHPLAGEDLHFGVTLVDIQAAA